MARTLAATGLNHAANQGLISRHAAAAKAIRATLKNAFPTVKFQVRSKSFSMGNDVSIHWTDGPTTKQVDSLVNQYEAGHFDGMTDMYEYSNSRDDIPQVKYVMTSRHMSDDAHRAAVALVNRKWGVSLELVTRTYSDGRPWLEVDPATDKTHGSGYGRISDEVWREFSATSLLCKDCHAHTLPGDQFCPMCGHSLTTLQAVA